MLAPRPDSLPQRAWRAALTIAAVTVLIACTGNVSQSAAEDDQVAAHARHDRDGATDMNVTAEPPPAQIKSVPAPSPAAQTGRAGQLTREQSATQVAHADQSQVAIDATSSGLIAYSLMKIAPNTARTAEFETLDRERYESFKDNGVRITATQPVSTFSIDVDTGAYSNVRRFLNDGALPPSDAVRVEEMINYFSYGYRVPQNRDAPFAVNTQVAPTPWDPDTLLMQIGIKGFEVPANERPASNLVFLIDVSGSMHSTNKLPLLKQAFSLLADNLNDHDRVAIVVYAGASGVVLPPTAGDDAARIDDALKRLRAGGSTNGESGIRLAYQTARSAFIDGGINRVILATDGDFNVGIADNARLINLIEREREDGIALTTLGFGTGNYNDHMMERLADAGNGNYAYIDTLREARKVLVDELGATIHTIASDVKIQVEFNPAQIAEYRLIGYENRALNREDFNNDKIDAGEIGAGHTVTALYELTPVDSVARRVDPLRYGEPATATNTTSDELAFVRLRYKAPGAQDSTLLEMPLRRSQIRAPQETDEDFRFAAAVAAFGQQLRGGLYTGDYRLDETLALAGSALGEDRHGYRREFLALVERARDLAPRAGNAIGQVAPPRHARTP
jgi:Ca-activated chloride channel family protein